MSNLIFDDGMRSVIHDLLPTGVRAVGEIKRKGFISIDIEGDGVPDAGYCQMRVTLDLHGNVPVRIVKFEAVGRPAAREAA